MITNSHRRSLGADQRGAIMLLGIFMCAAVVGVMWYVAGLGDAVVYRQRMQEASDATAFSGAVLAARGMNLIVLINLIMAAVLAVRVALKMVQTILQVAAGVFYALSLIPFAGAAFAGAATASLNGANAVGRVLNTLNPIIDRTLEALHLMWTTIKTVVPPAASAGSLQVGGKYSPPVDRAVAYSNTLLKVSLPVEDGTEDKLCEKANDAVQELINGALRSALGSGVGGALSSVLNPIVDAIQAVGSAYFCGLGSGGKAPDMNKIFSEAANRICNDKIDGLKKDENEKRGKWLSLCSQHGATCQAPVFEWDQPVMNVPQDVQGTPAAYDLSAALNEYKTARTDRQKYDKGKCRKDEKKNQQTQFNQQQQSGGSASSSGNKKPAQVLKSWYNGHVDGQFVSLAWGDRAMMERGKKGVLVGAQQNKRGTAVQVTVPESSRFAFAQAEFFYDCSGKWQSCNRKEEAMWNFFWRARLHRWTEPISIPVSGFGIKAAWVETAAHSRPTTLASVTGAGNTRLKTQLLDELARVSADMANFSTNRRMRGVVH